MVWTLPANAPKTSGEAFAYVGTLKDGCTVDGLKILALAEALGLELYKCLAEGTDHPEVKKLLLENGHEELKHGQRVAKALEILTGQPHPLPPIDKNPIYTPMDPMPVTRASLNKLSESEFGGEALYAGIAASFDNPEVIALFRLNGAEELGHGRRLQQAATLLPE